METITIKLRCEHQRLVCCDTYLVTASDLVGIFTAEFDLDASWDGYDRISAIWQNGPSLRIEKVLNSNRSCVIPPEMFTRVGIISVNLVASASESNALTHRYTSFPAPTIDNRVKVNITGSETSPITPSQFEQFVDNVHDEVEVITGMSATATTLPAGSDATASYNDGVLYLGIPQGAKGETGDAGVGIASIVQNANYTLTINLDDGRSYTTTSIRGEKGEKGDTGATPNISIGTVETLDPSESATASMSGTAENPVLNLGIPQGRQGEVTLSQLEQILPTDTASGSIASFSDGCELFNAKSVVIGIEPIQDLHGYDKPWSGGNGKNKLNPTEAFGDYSGHTVNADGSVTVTSADSRSWVNMPVIPLKAGTYILSRDIMNGLTDIRTSDDDYASDVKRIWQNQTSNGAFTLASDGGIKIKANFSGTYPATFKFQLEEGSTATSYAPYSNICPISGWTGAEVARAQRNLFGGEYDAMYKLPYSIPSNTYMIASGTRLGSAGTKVYLYDANLNELDYWTLNTNESGSRYYRTFRCSSAVYYIKFTTEESTNLQFEIASAQDINATPTAYEQPATYPISWQTEAGTVYGGTLDVTTGVLTVDRAMVVLDGSQNMQINGMTANTSRFFYTASPTKANGADNFIADRFAYATTDTVGSAIGRDMNGGIEFRLSTSVPQTVDGYKTWFTDNPTTLVYPLATPQTYQLTPTDIALLQGQNNVWADCGDTEVTYKADIQGYIDKKINALI